MNTKVLLFLFLLTVASHTNAATHHFFVVEKDFLQTQKIVEEYLSTKSYEINQTDDKILEIYFDVPELLYLKQNGYVRYKAVEYLSKKKKRVKYKENIEYSVDNNSTYTFSVKHYENVKSLEEKHPFLSLVKRKERHSFLDKLHSDGIKYPTRLKEIVQVSKLVHTFKLNSDADNPGSISVNKVQVSSYDSETEFIMLEIDVKNSQVFIDDLNNILGIKKQKTVDNEYLITFKQMEKNVGLFYWILRYPYLVNLLYAVGFGVFGLLIVFGLFGKRLKSK